MFYLLLLKMNRQFGIESNMLNWFSSYLHGRKQRVILNGKHSDWYNVTSGVPQGSILGPTLFLMYINDIFDCVYYSELLLFADDCKIYRKITCPEDCDLLQDDLNRIFEWCNKCQMKLHPDKCFFMNFTMKKSRDIVSSYSIGNSVLERVFNMKDLGVHFTPNLNFNYHISKITSKSMQMLGFMKRVTKDFKEIKTLHVLYNSLVRSRLEFCSQIWNPTARTHVNKLERIQKKYLKHVCFKSNIMYDQFSYDELCEKFNLKSLQARRSISDLVFMKKILSNDINCPYLVGEVGYRVPQAASRRSQRRPSHDKPTFFVDSRLNVRRDSFIPRTLALSNHLSLYDEFLTSNTDFKTFISSYFF